MHPAVFIIDSSFINKYERIHLECIVFQTRFCLSGYSCRQFLEGTHSFYYSFIHSLVCLVSNESPCGKHSVQSCMKSNRTWFPILKNQPHFVAIGSSAVAGIGLRYTYSHTWRDEDRGGSRLKPPVASVTSAMSPPCPAHWLSHI